MATLRLRWLLALCAVLCAPRVRGGPMVPVDSALDGARESDPYRLPRSVVPAQYTLRLKPDLDPDSKEEKRKFEGKVSIEAEVSKKTSTIVLHASGIEVETSSVQKVGEAGDPANLVERHSFDNVHDFLILELTEELEEGQNILITIEYKGTLRDDMYGFYISTYKDQDDANKMLVATQFQPTHARKAFPCFDEPSFKARFHVTIVAPSDLQVLGNMPEEETKDLRDGNKEVTFQNSMLMSSYLVAFAVSPFVGETDEQDGIKFTTWSRPAALKWTAYSLQVSRPMLETLQEYTNIPYSISDNNKVDQVALPDFAAGAMENWGLITYRETALLYNDGSADARKRVATVIAHELLHMWFGNLITTSWWDTTWLNEGFARFFQYYVTDKVERDWNMWDQFLVDQHQMVFALDALSTSQALTHDVSTPAQVSASFGSITYNKGASVLRMISSTISPNNFQSALQKYLEENKFRSVTPENLFKHLKEYANEADLTPEEFEKFLRSWTEQPGFPVVSVIRDYDAKKCSISQRRFLLKGEASQSYYVPLTWAKQGGNFDVFPPKEFLLPDTPLELDGMPGSNEWVIFNVQETGFYRVNYDDKNWELLANHLQSSDNNVNSIHQLNRAQLLDDAFNLARAGHLSYDTAFHLADYLPRETEYVPWASALTAFSYLDRMLVNHPKHPVFKRYMLRQLDMSYERLQVLRAVPVDHISKLFMNRIADKACSLGHKSCNGDSKKRLEEYLKDQSTPVPADIRSVVYCYGIRETTEVEWDKVWELYTTSRDDVERGLLVNGLSCSNNENLLTKLLQHTIDGEHIRKQDASSVFTSVYSNPVGVEVALDFLDDNFDAVKQYYGSMGAIDNIVTGIAGRLTTSEQKDKLDTFVKKHQHDLETTGTAALLIVDENIDWLEENQDKIFKILEDNELKQHRIKRLVSPESYELYFEPNLESKSFKGSVKINILAESPTRVITLHASSLDITDTPTVTAEGSNIYLSHTIDEELEYLNIYLREDLRKNAKYIIDLKFDGHLREDMYGFYVSNYLDENGDEVTIAATQFQPTHARSAFPCFDEPSFKATFDVTIKTPSGYHALGNMPEKSNSIETGTAFHTTPRMSSYLLAFVVSDFESMDDLQGKVHFKTWARPNALSWANYSIQVSRSILEALEEYTGVPYTDPGLDYPLAKVDQVAVPDFSAGAMENWGLVTYRETALLYNDGTASARKSVATIIAHELAHMWFGNLVTTDWWSTTWLNEGFAQYFQFFITDKVKPSWRLMDQFLVDHHQAVFGTDSLATSAALTADAYTPAQVSARFGGITYSKGASVLRMISSIMGAENFQQVLQTYLRDNAYSTTNPDDLFDKFVTNSSAANLSEEEFRDLLRSWTEHAGFPVLSVTRNSDGHSVTIEQKRFLLKKSDQSDTQLYYVPLTWEAEGGNFSLKAPQGYITDKQNSVTVQVHAPTNQWLIFNVQESGFYRVNYDEENWKLIINYLAKSWRGIHVLNRAQLLDDAFNLARAGQLNYDIAVSVSDYLNQEKDYIPWSSALSAFSYLQRMLIRNENYDDFKNYVLSKLVQLYNDYQFQDKEEHIEKLLLNRISAWACSLEHKHCTDAALSAFKNFIDKDEQVPADLRSVAYCYGIRHSDNIYWDKMWEKYKASLDNAERAIIMAGLACSNSETKLNELLGYSIAGTDIRKQDASSVFTAVYGNSEGVLVALKFLNENFEEVQKYYGSMGAINNIVIGISGRLTTDDEKELMEAFVATHSDSLGATGPSALEIVQENLEWLDEYAENVLRVFHQHTPNFARVVKSSLAFTLILVFSTFLIF